MQSQIEWLHNTRFLIVKWPSPINIYTRPKWHALGWCKLGDIGFSGILMTLHFSDIGCSDIDLGLSDIGWVA
jgi:hypothetical protein